MYSTYVVLMFLTLLYQLRCNNFESINFSNYSKRIREIEEGSFQIESNFQKQIFDWFCDMSCKEFVVSIRIILIFYNYGKILEENN